ncbi:tRNA (5-methylaminomethyl-2-thiouridine)(34)-methyltransferase MnmD [Mucilaginibacter sp. UR6-11]|uniref:tRNA (5-methylaminomethyl-2-thiouridine)(34)-methyltransferase MnmD n=1 Tax=Mucilaginibacter sp. UR6-11 TaxID=1435644 RepID=UPI001E3CED05|nr:tRNA (5-methylaminomethyl-2-thiouridine)(34)-methyltransferase MnmD [Mucilaginibacter sp. UR6-11]MCC8423839.1 tRNA (5-methylaminomethyl-2-thiouridine)(34)-methyltransferase MnmD [Mucilaginibacter sp. UR6-11]
MLELVKTADGSNTLYNPQVGENYHSRHGALQESQHVFLQSGLQYFLDTHPAKAVSVLEVGFGTGLNFLLTADYCTQQNISLTYTGIEAYPLNDELVAGTGYEQYIPAGLWEAFRANYQAALINSTRLNLACQLQIANSKLLDFKSAIKFDVIYFDAFAAIHQPEMWNEEAIGHTISFLKEGGVFVTYAITGNLKRMLKTMGLQIQKIPGAAGKREMLRATR